MAQDGQPGDARGTASDEEPFEYRASYLTPAFDRARMLCRAAVSPTGLHHVACYDADGIPGFAYDVFHYRELAPSLVPGVDLDRQRRTYRTTGRQIFFKVHELDRRLADLDSGDLIRVVFESSDGAFVYNRVRAGEHLVGVTLDPRAVERADRRMADLTDRLLELRDQASPDGGGYQRAGVPPAPGTESMENPVLLGPGAVEPDNAALVDLFAAAVRPWDLHYAAYLVDGDLALSVDALEHDHLTHYFHGITPQRRRDLYVEIGRAVAGQTEQLGFSLRTMIGGDLVRIVLDVQEGALFLRRAAEKHYLLGVTLSQARVHDADRRFTALFERARTWLSSRASV